MQHFPFPSLNVCHQTANAMHFVYFVFVSTFEVMQEACLVIILIDNHKKLPSPPTISYRGLSDPQRVQICPNKKHNSVLITLVLAAARSTTQGKIVHFFHGGHKH